MNESTEKLMLESVREDGYSLQFIKNPTKKVVLEAVKQNAFAIAYVKNPTEEMVLEAVKQHGEIIQDIKNPTIEQISIAVSQSIRNIKYIDNDKGLFNMNILKSNWGSYRGRLITCVFEGQKFVVAGCYIANTFQDFFDKLNIQKLKYPTSFNKEDIDNVLKELKLFFE